MKIEKKTRILLVLGCSGIGRCDAAACQPGLCTGFVCGDDEVVWGYGGGLDEGDAFGAGRLGDSSQVCCECLAGRGERLGLIDADRDVSAGKFNDQTPRRGGVRG